MVNRIRQTRPYIAPKDTPAPRKGKEAQVFCANPKCGAVLPAGGGACQECN